MVRRVMLLGGAMLVVAFASATNAQASGWSVKATPAITNADDVVLNGVSCANGDACQAVGTYVNSQGTYRPLAESWDGHTWTQQPVPVPGSGDARVPTRAWLFGVSCTAANACTAVGTFLNFPNLNGALLVERWDGAHWTRQTAQNPQEFENFLEFRAVSCTSATNCTAVGDYDAGGNALALAERWDGTTWKMQKTPEVPRDPGGDTQNFLNGVSCANANTCIAVGRGGTPTAGEGTLAMKWNGSSWTIKPTPDQSGVAEPDGVHEFEAVSCAAANACTAVGVPAVAERWNGTSWAQQDTTSDASLLGVSCASGSSCIAVGSDGDHTRPSTLTADALMWNGGSFWGDTSPPSPYGADQLNSVSCNASGSCMAVGESSRGALAERYIPPPAT
jgi:hypothetical protein